MAELSLEATRPQRGARRSGGRGFGVLLAGVVLAGLGGSAWYGWHHGWLRALPEPAAPAALIAPSSSPSTTTAAIVSQGNLIATNAALADATARLTALQQRLAELNQQALAASTQANRAEMLLVAFAARRAIDRGQPLGIVEPALRMRFGDSQAKSVDTVVNAARKPVTLTDLSSEFARIEPKLVSGTANEGTWDWLTRQFGAMFIIRRDDTPSPLPESRIARARTALQGQRVDLAIAEIERMPGKDAANDWLARAREWVATQDALDQLESAALAMPPAAPVAQPKT
jgi:hypothetical protein